MNLLETKLSIAARLFETLRLRLIKILAMMAIQLGCAPLCFGEASTQLQLRKTLPSNLYQAAISFDGRSLAVLSDSGYHLWELASGRVRAELPLVDRGIGRMAFSRDGRLFCCPDPVWDLKGTIDVFDIRSANTSKFETRKEKLAGVRVAPDARTLVAAHGAGLRDGFPSVHLWDLQSRKKKTVLASPTEGFVVATYGFSPNGATLVVSGGVRRKGVEEAIWDGRLEFWDLKEMKLVRSIDTEKLNLGNVVGNLTFTPNGERIFMRTGDIVQKVAIWDCVKEKWLEPLPVTFLSIHVLALSPDAKTLVAGGANAGLTSVGVCDVIDLAARKTVQTLRFEGKKATNIHFGTFTPDGTKVILGGNLADDAYLGIYDAVGAEPVDFATQCQPILKRQKGSLPKEIIITKEDRSAIQNLWKDLAAMDAAVAYKAMCGMLARPHPTVGFLREHLSPVAAADEKRIRQLLTELSSDKSAEREAASKELEDQGELAKKHLLAGLKKGLSADGQRHARELLKKIDEQQPSPKTLQVLRALEVLEYVASPDAELVIGKMARGAREARVTYDACALLVRLAGAASVR